VVIPKDLGKFANQANRNAVANRLRMTKTPMTTLYLALTEHHFSLSLTPILLLHPRWYLRFGSLCGALF
jgi:hypothetical protein